MWNYVRQIRQPVRRQGAENNLLIFLISFAGSVLFTRIFLSFTHYPFLGRGPFHIAHVLWGGIFLFFAALLPIVFTNRWTYSMAAFLGGIGTGLFIDEIGKFITLSNNYFYQPAAAIIYAFFLLTVFLYVRLKRPPHHNAKTEIYHALDVLEELLDGDLDKEEFEDIIDRLKKISKESSYPELKHLAVSILEFLRTEKVKVAESEMSLFEKAEAKLRHFEAKILSRTSFRAILAVLTAYLAIESVGNIILLVNIAFSHTHLQQLISRLIATQTVNGSTELILFILRISLEAFEGVLFFIALYFWIFKKDKNAIFVSIFALLTSLTTIHLLAFYFDQFRAVFGSFAELCMLLGILRYKMVYQNPTVKHLKE